MRDCSDDTAIDDDGILWAFNGMEAVRVPPDQVLVMVKAGYIELNPVEGSVYRITPAGRAALDQPDDQ